MTNQGFPNRLIIGVLRTAQQKNVSLSGSAFDGVYDGVEAIDVEECYVTMSTHDLVTVDEVVSKEESHVIVTGLTDKGKRVVSMLEHGRGVLRKSFDVLPEYMGEKEIATLEDVIKDIYDKAQATKAKKPEEKPPQKKRPTRARKGTQTQTDPANAPIVKTLTERQIQVRAALKRNPDFWFLNTSLSPKVSGLRVGDKYTYEFKSIEADQESGVIPEKGDLVLSNDPADETGVQALLEVYRAPVGDDGALRIGLRPLQFLPKPLSYSDLQNIEPISEELEKRRRQRDYHPITEAAFIAVMVAAGVDVQQALAAQPDYDNVRFRDLNSIEPAIGVEALAAQMAGLIKSLKSEPGMMVGIFGRWGRGKTYLFEQIWKLLKPEGEESDVAEDQADGVKKKKSGRKPKGAFARVEFHAWKYQDTEASWAYLYELLSAKFNSEARNWLSHKWRLVLLNLKRGNNWELWMFSLSLLFGIGAVLFNELPWWPTGFDKSVIVPVASLGVGTAIISGFRKLYKDNVSKARELLKQYTARKSYAEVLGLQAEIQNEIRILLKFWFRKDPNRKVLLFVDDIDRCSEDRIIQIVDSLRVMLEDEEIYAHLIVVAAIDERILRRAIRTKYKQLVVGDDQTKHEKLNELTEEYMDKLFITGIRLGELTPGEKHKIFEAITSGLVDEITVVADTPEESPGLSAEIPEGGKVENTELPKPDKEQGTPIASFDQSVYKLDETAYEINSAEATLLKEGIDVLKHATPRQIRIFYYRYVLARNFIKDMPELKGWGGVQWELTVLVYAIAYLTNADLMGEHEMKVDELMQQEVADKEEEETGKKVLKFIMEMDEKKRRHFCKLIEMVVAY